MARLEEVGERDGWRCWLCDDVVDPAMSVNDPRGPSVDACVSKAKAKGRPAVEERLAHRACNTKKGAIEAVVPWPDHLFVVEPAPILKSVDRLGGKGGREIMARCPTVEDADEAATWLADRISRLRPELRVTTSVEPGGGQHLVVLRADR